MASIKDVEQVADDLSNLVDQLRKELSQGASFDKLVQVADEISEHADEAAGTFSTMNEALMSRLNELKSQNQSGSSAGGSSGGGSASRAKARS
jgi:ABC-type transporter Mla subunit MlaD